jgi:hypothetical protein
MENFSVLLGKLAENGRNPKSPSEIIVFSDRAF